MLLIYLRYYHVESLFKLVFRASKSIIRPPNYLINACLVICVIDCLRPHTYRLPYHLSFGESSLDPQALSDKTCAILRKSRTGGCVPERRTDYI